MKTIIVNMGSFLPLNVRASIGAFNELAKPKKIDWTVMSQVLEQDEKFKKGGCTAAEFRTEIKSLLKIEVTDLEFDNAWNAMLGDTSQFNANLTEFKNKLSDYKIILCSGTNPIHKQKLIPLTDISADNSLLGMPLYLSYLHKVAYVDLLAKIIKDEKLDPTETAIVVPVYHGLVSPIKERDETVEDGIRNWAKANAVSVIDYDQLRDKNILTAIQSYIASLEQNKLRA